MKSSALFIESSAKPSTSVDSESFELETSPFYKGLSGIEYSSIPDLFPRHPVLNFPVLTSSQSAKTLKMIRVLNQNLSNIFENYQKKSPFQPKSSLYSIVPKNSANLHSFYSNLYSLSSTLHKGTRGESTNLESCSSPRSSISKQELTESQKNLILELQRNFACKNVNKKYLQSISSNSSYSQELDLNSSDEFQETSELKVRTSKYSEGNKENFEALESSISKIDPYEPVFTSIGLEMSMLEWDRKRKQLREQAKMNTTKNAYLLSESDDLGSELMFQSKIALDTARALQQSVDSPPEDEGQIRISCANRLFLDGHTASKQRLVQESIKRPGRLAQKELADSVVLDLETTRNFPSFCSPLLRKIVICEEAKPALKERESLENLLVQNGSKAKPCSEKLTKNMQVAFSTTVVGFISSPSIRYSSEPKAFSFITLENLTITDMLSVPVLRSLQEIPVKLLTCGYEHVVALSLAGKIYTWGIGSAGCLGHNNHENYEQPEAINHIFAETFTWVECGGYHSLAITETGLVWAWGRNDVGQCAVTSKHLLVDDIGKVALRPFKVKCFPHDRVTSVACGEAHSLFLTEQQRVFSAGWNDEGQLGVLDCRGTVNLVPIKEKVVKIRAGSIFSLALTDAGKVAVWGNGEHGELGLGNSIKRVNKPTFVDGLKDEFIVDVICGESHCLALAVSKVFAWGKGVVDDFNDEEKFPRGSDIICYAPVPVVEVDSIQTVLMGKISQGEFSRMVSEKLQRIKTQDM